ncbi:MAG: pyridoxamine 5'-phosphate oxidase family protein [Anaerolineae bacterium]
MYGNNYGNAQRAQAIEKLRDLIKGINIAMLTTVDPADGTLHSRPMGTQQVEFDGQLWFFTDDHSQKMHEIFQQQQVNVSYAHPGKMIYVSVSGTARQVDDRAKMEELWNPLLKAWFTEEIDTPGITLLCVDVQKAEYWESDGKLATVLQFAKALISGERRDDEMGDNQKLQLK